MILECSGRVKPSTCVRGRIGTRLHAREAPRTLVRPQRAGRPARGLLRRERMSLRLALFVLLPTTSLALVGATPAALAALPPAIRFEAEATGREALGVSALAFDAARSRLAFGDGRRVTLRGSDGAFVVASRRGPVTALAFAADGALLAGSSQGLDRIDTDGRRTACELGPGEAGAAVAALAAGGGFVAVGTARGAFVSRDARRFVPLADLPAGPVDAVALRARPGGATLFIVTHGAVHEAALALAAGSDAVAARRSGAFDGLALHRARFVGVDEATGEVVAASADAISVKGEGDDAWRTYALALPPGAGAVRALRALGRAWVATDRGLLAADGWDGPFARAASPAGVTPALALAASDQALYVGTGRGLLVGRAAVAASSGGPSRGALIERLQAEPSVQAVHGAALRYLDLGPGRPLRLKRGVDHRGLLPIVSLHLARELSIARTRDYDESYVSGDLRRLNDRNRDQGKQVEAGLSFSWDLGDAAYHPEAIDVSREAREVIELRDDVLDEITQLYFERRRALVELGRLPDAPESDGERIRLRLRADELAAGLDAWTGGWFSRNAPPVAP